MAIALVVNAQIAGNKNGGTSASIDTTGANLLVMHVSCYRSGAPGTISDSKGNTWTPLTAYDDAGNDGRSRIYYAANPTVGSGHTFTVSGTNSFATTEVAAFSGADTSSPYDVENGASAAFVTSIQPGSVTPSANGAVLVAGLNHNQSGTVSINSGFTITNQGAALAANYYGGAMAYLVQTTAAAINPTWSWSTSDKLATSIAVFKAAGGGTPVGLATETDAAQVLAGKQLRALGLATETDAAQALAGKQIRALGLATGTDSALALAGQQLRAVGLATETDTALALSSTAGAQVGMAVETDTAQALTGAQIRAVGRADESDTALALSGITGTAPGVASETDTAFALAAVQKLLVGAAQEVDTALRLNAGTGYTDLELIIKILSNRQELNAGTGTFTVYDDDSVSVLFTANAWSDAAGTIPYSGGTLGRIDALA